MEAVLQGCLVLEIITKKVTKKRSSEKAIVNAERCRQEEIQAANFDELIEGQAIATPSSSQYILQSGCTPRSITATPRGTTPQETTPRRQVKCRHCETVIQALKEENKLLKEKLARIPGKFINIDVRFFIIFFRIM